MVYPWVLFLCLVFFLLALDLGVFHKKSHKISYKEAMGWSLVWIFCGLLFSSLIYLAYHSKILGLGQHVDPLDGKTLDGFNAWIKYLTGYIIEKSLSMDNIFVIAMIFQSLKIPAELQHRVLYWGILGALVLRGVLILLGASLVAQYHWILYLFGIFLLFTGFKMLMPESFPEEEKESSLMAWLKKRFHFSDEFHGEQFWFLNAQGIKTFTPLALALVMVEAADVIFAVDSIPAIFGITADPFIIFTSNVFAILGLRSLYFILADLMDAFHYLKTSLALILVLVGIKMLCVEYIKNFLGDYFHFYVLSAIFVIFLGGILASWKYPQRKKKE